MQIGLFYQIQVPKPWTAESESQRFFEMMDQVTYAEEVGMQSVWFVEHHFRSEWSHSSAPADLPGRKRPLGRAPSPRGRVSFPLEAPGG